jgi:hypothetical protein
MEGDAKKESIGVGSSFSERCFYFAESAGGVICSKTKVALEKCESAR